MTARRHPDHAAHCGHDAGFTLVEVLVAVSLTSVLLLVATQTTLTVTRSARQSSERTTARVQLTAALDRLGRAIAVADPVTAAAPDRLTATVVRDAGCQRHDVRQAAGRLTDTVTTYGQASGCTDSTGVPTGTAVLTVADGLDPAAPVFSYVDGAGAPLPPSPPDASQVARVTVTLTRPTHDNHRPVTATASTFLRNRT